jgi:hypothetical protein
MPRLQPTIVPVTELSGATTDAMFALFGRYYERADEARFRRDLGNKQVAIVLRDEDGELGGFSTLRVLEPHETSRPCRILYSGDTVVDKRFWGNKALQRGFTRFMFRERFRHPVTPLYWLLTTKGYRTYLLLARYFSDAYPRHDRPTPAVVSELMSHIGHLRYGEHYDDLAGVIRHGGALDRLKPGVADIHAADLAEPHIKFFAQANPGHQNGDELLCLARIHKVDPVRIGFKLMRRRLAK